MVTLEENKPATDSMQIGITQTKEAHKPRKREYTLPTSAWIFPPPTKKKESRKTSVYLYIAAECFFKFYTSPAA